MDKLQICAQGGGKYTALLNPESFKHSMSINYTASGESYGKSNDEPIGDSAPETKFKSYSPQTLHFDLLLDSSGVIDNPNTKKGVQSQLNSLKKVIYNYVGSEHEPSIVVITWGNFSFKGRLTSMGVEYVLFNSSGMPQRAKVSLDFTQYMEVGEKALSDNQSSPDLTHMIRFKASDSLPALCEQIYRDPKYYMEVARANHLTSVRNIKPGTLIYFPPLD